MAGSTEARNPGDDQGRADCVMAALRLFARIEDAYGTEYAQQVFTEASTPKFRRAIRMLRLRSFVEEQLRAGRTKQDIVDHLTFREALSLDLDPKKRREVMATRSRMLQRYGIAPATAERPASIRKHIDAVLAEDLPWA